MVAFAGQSLSAAGQGGVSGVQGFLVVIMALAYVTLLFVIASLGDRWSAKPRTGADAPVHLRAQPRHLLHFLDLLRLGRACYGARPRIPRHLYRPGARLPVRLPAAQPHHPARQSEKITSIADFLGARYGKSFAVASIATLIAVVGADALHRAAAEGDLRLGQPDGRALQRRAR